jgi:N-acetylglucosaminyl-diphospho-decaprenol L-rhamnosyltransferase
VDSVSVAAVVVTWNSAEVLPGLLGSLPAAMGSIDWRLVVVDNASEDDTLGVVRRLAPAATVVSIDHNAGYAAGVNAGWDAAGATEALLLVNPDVRLAPGSVEELAGALAEPRTGIVVPRILDQNGRLSFTLRREPSVRRLLGEALLGGHRAGRWPSLGETVVDAGSYSRPALADWAGGAAMLVSRPCLETVGRWDESFWLYSEETDFALRARDHGFLLRYVPSAIATHLEGEANTDPRLWATLTVNRVRLFRRRHGRVHSWAFWAVALVSESLRCIGGRQTSRAAVRALLRTMPM